MIVCSIELKSGLEADRDKDLGTLVIDNITTHAEHHFHGGSIGNYRARIFRGGTLAKFKGDARAMIRSQPKPFREAKVLNHRRNAEPVHNLVAKALAALGYK